MVTPTMTAVPLTVSELEKIITVAILDMETLSRGVGYPPSTEVDIIALRLDAIKASIARIHTFLAALTDARNARKVR